MKIYQIWIALLTKSKKNINKLSFQFKSNLDIKHIDLFFLNEITYTCEQ